MRTAFKEWAVIVDALGRGDQILVLRKGGILEGPGGFKVEHPAFFLFPTLFHQQGDSIIPSAQQRYQEIASQFPGPEVVRVEFLAEVAAWHKVESLEMAQRLQGQHIWKEEVIEQRYGWGKDQNIFALALRVCRLAAPVELPMSPTYGGCKSWVELEQDVVTDAAQPVLNDEEFGVKLDAFRKALESGAQAR